MKRNLHLHEAMAILDYMGMPRFFSVEPREASWNGENIAFGPDTRGDDLIHELGHWLICPAKRRSLEDFGLGAGFRSTGYPKLVVRDDVERDCEELAACIYEIGVSYYLGFNWKKTADIVSFEYENNWSWNQFVEGSKVPVVMKVLHNEKLFKNNLPVIPRLKKIKARVLAAKKELRELLSET